MTRARRIWTVFLVAVAAACQPRGVSDEPAAPVDAPSEDQIASPTLEDIADAIDPGPRELLTTDLPEWLSRALELPATDDPRVLAAEAEAAWARWERSGKEGGEGPRLEPLLHVARAVALAERAAGGLEDADVDALLRLERVYNLLDAPALANDQNLFASFLQTFAAVAAEHGDVEARVALDELSRVVFGALQRAGDLRRRTVALLLRAAPDRPELADVLARLGPRLLAQDEQLAVGVMRRAMALRGTAAESQDWLGLASVCARALDVPCAREAVERAEALAPAGDEALGERLASVRDQTEQAGRVAKLRGAEALDDRLALARALFELQRLEEARALYEGLRRTHPEDARPVVGYARTVLVDGLDFAAAFDALERARPTAHLDEDWYELAIGIRASALLYHILPQIADRSPDQIFEILRPSLDQMRADIDALEALGADEGRVLRFVHELGMEVWPLTQSDDPSRLATFTGSLLPRAARLRTDVPKSRHAYVLWLSAAELSRDREAALAVLDEAPPSAHAESLALRRAQAATDLVALWDARDRIDDMLALVETVDQPDRPAAARRLVADAHVIAHRLGRAEPLPELERRYLAAMKGGGERDPVLLNNLAVVLQAQGRTDEAQSRWEEALALLSESPDDLVRLNLLAARIAGGGSRPADLTELESLATSGSDAEVRLLARAWQVEVSTGARRQAARRALEAAAREEHETSVRPRILPGEGGVVLRGSFSVSVGYSSADGLQIELDLTGIPWLVVPCPVPIPTPR